LELDLQSKGLLGLEKKADSVRIVYNINSTGGILLLSAVGGQLDTTTKVLLFLSKEQESMVLLSKWII